MNTKALQNIGYGLYLLTAKEGERDNGCIINTFFQLASKPLTVGVSVNKQNYTHDMILKAGAFCVSVLTTETPFGLIEHFGFKSGRDEQKFFKNPNETRANNGVLYLSSCSNAYFACRVTKAIDFESHTVFIAELTDCEILSDEKTLTYAYYHENIKPKPQKAAVKGWRCKICGYVYEGEELPKDYICPLCKHPAEDFERIE